MLKYLSFNEQQKSFYSKHALVFKKCINNEALESLCDEMPDFLEKFEDFMHDEYREVYDAFFEGEDLAMFIKVLAIILKDKFQTICDENDEASANWEAVCKENYAHYRSLIAI